MSSSSASSSSSFDPLDTHPPLPARAVRGKGSQGGAKSRNKGAANNNNNNNIGRTPKSVTIKGFGGPPGNNNNNSSHNQNNKKSALNGINNANTTSAANGANNTMHNTTHNPKSAPSSSVPTSVYASPAGIFITPAHTLPPMMAGRYASSGPNFNQNGAATNEQAEGRLRKGK